MDFKNFKGFQGLQRPSGVLQPSRFQPGATVRSAPQVRSIDLITDNKALVMDKVCGIITSSLTGEYMSEYKTHPTPETTLPISGIHVINSLTNFKNTMAISTKSMVTLAPYAIFKLEDDLLIRVLEGEFQTKDEVDTYYVLTKLSQHLILETVGSVPEIFSITLDLARKRKNKLLQASLNLVSKCQDRLLSQVFDPPENMAECFSAALYYFLTTNNPRCALVNSIEGGYYPRIVTTMTGILVGASYGTKWFGYEPFKDLNKIVGVVERFLS